ncbi:MAG: hypothetical protein AB7H92_18720 [Microbacteriaceae bacterium]
MATYRLQDPNYTYEDNWDAFTAKLARYAPKTIDSLVNEAKVDQKLAMIVGLSVHWRNAYSRTNYLDRVRQAQARIIEERRMTPDPAAFRPYVSTDTRALMPPIKLHRGRYAHERQRDFDLAAGFWRALRRGSRRGQPVALIAERERTRILRGQKESYQFWLLQHPDRSPVPQADIDALHATFRSINPPIRGKRPTIDPAGITPERALAIAMRVQEASGR